jgi:hypothetical protein
MNTGQSIRQTDRQTGKIGGYLALAPAHRPSHQLLFIVGARDLVVVVIGDHLCACDLVVVVIGDHLCACDHSAIVVQDLFVLVETGLQGSTSIRVLVSLV